MTDLVREIEMRIEELHELVQKLKVPREHTIADDLLGQVRALNARDEVRA